jgi:hypothetical protein
MKFRPSTMDRERARVQIGMDRQVLSFIAAALVKDPNVEEGGKFVGHVLASSDPRLRELHFDPEFPAILICDFLPSGPKATRTAVELQPDGEYQETLFRQLERIDHEIEHVGTWHSHHCNGLQTLSSGDVAGYFRTVNRPEYRLNYFLASLVTRVPEKVEEHGWIAHYLFVRSDEECYKVDPLIKMIDWPTRFGHLTGHSSHVCSSAAPEYCDRENLASDSDTGGPWYVTPQGKRALAEDKRIFTERFGTDVSATRRGGRITLTGCSGRTSVSMGYPAGPHEKEVIICVQRGAAAVLEIKGRIEWRKIALTAALAAAAELA